MKSITVLALLILFAPLYSIGQITIKGQVFNKNGEKIIADIYQYGIYLSKDFQGDFEITIDSLGGSYYFGALGYNTKEVIIRDSTFIIVTLDKKRNKPKKYVKKQKREERRKKKFLRQMRKGKQLVIGGCCFVSGTKILMADGTEQRIEHLKVGDSILTNDFIFQKIIISTITNLDTVLHQNIINLSIENNIQIMNTIDHPFYVYEKGICSYDPKSTYKNYGIRAKQLETGDVCYLYVGGKLIFVHVLSIEKVDGAFMTYNISGLNNNNNFFANRVLVNNESINNIQLLTKNKKH